MGIELNDMISNIEWPEKGWITFGKDKGRIGKCVSPDITKLQTDRRHGNPQRGITRNSGE